jgi:membrane protein
MGLWSRQGLGWRQLAVRIYRDMNEDSLYGHCAELAYTFLFSAFPLLLFLTTLLGYLAASAGLRAELFGYLRTIAPSQGVYELLVNTLDEIARGRGGTQLYLSLAAAVWVASNGMIVVGRTLNQACGLRETRPWWNRRLTAIVLTFAFSALVVAALVLILYGNAIGGSLAARGGRGWVFQLLWNLLQWPLVVLFLVVSFEMVYNYAPNLGSTPHRAWWTPGAVTGVSLWLAVTWGLKLYLAQFGVINKAYGSLGAVIVLLIWFYLSAFALLMGGEINSELARARNELRERQGLPPIGASRPPRAQRRRLAAGLRRRRRA